jgi:hypothetical protein
MTHRLPPELQPVADGLVANHSYLWRTFRESGVTCRVCARPTALDLCEECASHDEATYPTADLVGTYVYAPYGTQTYHVVKGYKGNRPGSTWGTMASLLAVGLRSHRDCLMTLSGSRDMRWAVVPSTSGRDGEHPLMTAVRKFAFPDRETVLEAAQGGSDYRGFDPHHFLPRLTEVPDSLVVIDDTWVGGGHAQSAAAALKLVGVRYVALFAVARALNPNYPPTKAFLGKHVPRRFAWELRPWTQDGICPA